jgi:glycerol-3-phosphate acyltransferase PlsX
VTTSVRPVRIALDLLGGDQAPDALVAGGLAALAADPALHLVVVGPKGLRPHWEPVADRVTLVPTDEGVGMADAPVRAVRSRPTSVRLAVEAVRQGNAEAVVSVGPTGAAVAAAVTQLGKLPGFRRPALAVVLPALAHPVVLLDVGAHAGGSDDDVVRHGRLGAAFAAATLGLAAPRVGLLSVGTEPGKGDALRKKADRGLTGSGLRYVGLVEGYEVPLGGRADVVVTDGFTGNIVLKTLEGSLALASAVTGAEFPSGDQRAAILLGVPGTVVIGHGAAGPSDVAACLANAAVAVREDRLARIRAALNQPFDADDADQGESSPAHSPSTRPQARMTAVPAAT